MAKTHRHELYYKARFAGIVPVYIDRLDVEGPLLVERHWAFVPLTVIIDGALGLFNFVMEAALPEWEAVYPIRVVAYMDPPVVIDCRCEEAQ